MNKQDALIWLDVCISNEQLIEKRNIAWTKISNNTDQDKLTLLKESEWRIEILNDLKDYVKRSLR